MARVSSPYCCADRCCDLGGLARNRLALKFRRDLQGQGREVMRVDRVRAQSLVSDASRNLEPCSARRREVELRDHGPHGLPQTPAVDALEVRGGLE